MLVADRTGRYRSGASAEERAATKTDLDAIWDVTRGVVAIADTNSILVNSPRAWSIGTAQVFAPRPRWRSHG